MTTSRRRWLTMATGIASLVLASGAVHADSDRVEGELTVHVADYPIGVAKSDDNSEGKQIASDRTSARQKRYRAEYEYYLETDNGREIALEPGESGAFDGMRTGARVAVEGRRMALSADSNTTPERMRVTDAERLAPAQESEGNGSGRATADGNPVAAGHDDDSIDKRRVLGVVVNFEGSSETVDPSDAKEALFAVRRPILGGSRSVESYYRFASGGSADSGGQLAFSPPSGGDPKVAEVEIDASTGSCNYPSWGDKADDKLSSQGIGYDSHRYRVYFLPPDLTSSCQWGGTAGARGCDECRAWIRSANDFTAAHELGHNLGLGHSKAKIDGEIREYGDETIMGNGGGLFINVPQRDFLGFYDDHPDKLQTHDSGVRTFTIGSLHTDFGGGQPHAIQLPMDNSDKQYYIYHLADKGPGGGFIGPSGKVAVTRAKPGNPYTVNLEYIKAGEQFTDDDNNITVTVESIGDDQATVKVQNGKQRITAIDTDWTMAPSKEHEGQLEANDPQDRDLTFSKADGASQGNVSIKADGSYVYTANDDASGSDSFTFRVQTGQTTSEPATARIDFNQPPQTSAMKLEVDAGAQTGADFDASDKESKPDSLAYELTDKPDKGNVSLKSGDTFVYQANDGASGEDSFTYRASDSFSQSKESKVTIDLPDTDDSSNPGDDGDSSTNDDDSGSDDDGSGTNSGSDDDDSGTSSGSNGSSGSDDDGGGGGGAIGGGTLMLLLGLVAAARRRVARG